MPTQPWLTPAPPAAAIEIASSRVTVVEMSTTRGARPSVLAQATERLPEGAVVPALTGLNIVDPVEVAGALERAFAAADMSVPSRAALVIPDSVARVSLITLDELPARAADLDQVVRWQIKKSTPFPLDEAQLSHFVVRQDGPKASVAVVVARRSVVAEYEALATHLGIQPGIVDLASFNVMNAVIGAGASAGDWLLVHLASEATSLAILRGPSLMFYRHRTAVDEEPLGSLVHQTAMYHQDRLGGGTFARAWVCGDSVDTGAARAQIAERLGIPVDSVDVRSATDWRRGAPNSQAMLDSLVASVGVLLRERAA